MDLLFNFEAIEALFESENIDLNELAMRGSVPTPPEIRSLVWAGSLHAQPELKKEDVGAIINGTRYFSLIKQITEAIKEALAVRDDDDSEEAE